MFKLFCATTFAVATSFSISQVATADVYVHQLSSISKIYVDQAFGRSKFTRTLPATSSSRKTRRSVLPSSDQRVDAKVRQTTSKPSIRISDFSQTSANKRLSFPSVRGGVQIFGEN